MKIRHENRNHILRPGVEVKVDWRPVFSTTEGKIWMKATVVDVLSTQFTAVVEVDGEPLTYRFYSDVGETWRPL